MGLRQAATSLSLPASTSHFGHSLVIVSQSQSLVYHVALCAVGTQPMLVQESPEPMVTTSETQRRDAICLGSSLVWNWGPPPRILGGGGHGLPASWLGQGPGLGLRPMG